jgi:RNA polymerase sigma-70 factor (ECF subfamily)
MTIHLEDQAQVQRLLAGDEAVFDEFYEAYYDRIFRFCLRRVSDRELAYDLVQQTLEQVFKYMHGYRGEASLYTWICQICRNEIASWFKRAGNDARLHVTLDDNPAVVAILESEQADELSDDDRRETAQMVHIVLDALSPKYAAVLQLKYYEGLSTEEISQVMGASLVAVQSLLARARGSFKQLFKDLQSEQAPSDARSR